MERLHLPKFDSLLRWRGRAVHMSDTFLRLSQLPKTRPPIRDEQTGVLYSASLYEAAEKLGKSVSEVTAVDLLDDAATDFPPGPASELGGRVASHYRNRMPSEKRRLASIGKAAVDEYEARSTGTNAS